MRRLGMAVAKGPLVGGLLVSTGVTLGISGYVLVVAVLLRAASEVLPADSVAALGSAFVLLGGALVWLGGVILPEGPLRPTDVGFSDTSR